MKFIWAVVAALTFDFGISEIFLWEKAEHLYELKHSRDAEREADERGLKMVELAGFDPVKATNFIDSLHSYIELF